MNSGTTQNFACAIRGSTVDVDDYSPFPRESSLKSSLDRFDGLPNSSRVIVRGNSNKQVHFANTHELSKEIVAEKEFVCHLCTRFDYWNHKGEIYRPLELKAAEDGTHTTGMGPV